MISHLNIIGITWMYTLYGPITSRLPPRLPLSSTVRGKIILQYASYFQTYNKRWYILFIFSWIASAQYLTWNIYGPISTSVERAYGWYDYEIALMPNWGTMWFLVAMPIFCWLLERKGLTFVTRSAAFLILLSTILRDVSTDKQTFSAMAHLSSLPKANLRASS